MYHASGNRAHPRKSLERVACDRQRDGGHVFDLVARHLEEGFYFDFLDRDAVKLRQLFDQARREYALDDQVGTRCNRSQRK